MMILFTNDVMTFGVNPNQIAWITPHNLTDANEGTDIHFMSNDVLSQMLCVDGTFDEIIKKLSDSCCRTAVEEALKRVRGKAQEMREDGPADMRDMIWFLDAELKKLEKK